MSTSAQLKTQAGETRQEVNECLIRLIQTDNHYLLSIPREQKTRAQNIKPRHWDPQRRVWVYPRNPEMLKLLRNEFEEDIKGANTTPKNSPDKEGVSLQKNKQTIKELNEELNNARKELDVLKNLSIANVSTIDALNKQIHELSENNPQVQGVEYSVRTIVNKCAGQDSEFAKFLDELEINTYLPIEIQNRTQARLQSRLKVHDSKITFFQLIRTAQQELSLEDDVVDCLHTIRKQRNHCAHVHDAVDRLPRVILVILAGALAWKHI